MSNLEEYTPCPWGTDDLFGPGIDSRNRVFVLLDLIEEATSREQIWRLFNVGWPSCDAVLPHIADELLGLLVGKMPFGTAFLEGQDAEFFASLPEKVKIYRGCMPSRRHGMAWTTDLEIARGFAVGHRGIRVPNGAIYTANVSKSEILTVLTEREESEVIVHPWALKSMRKVVASAPSAD